MKTIQIDIDGNWQARNFAEFFGALDAIYSVLAALELERHSVMERDSGLLEGVSIFSSGSISKAALRSLMRVRIAQDEPGQIKLSRGLFENAPELLDQHEHLQVLRCVYASPGSVDLAGLGQAMGHLKDLLIKLLDASLQKAERKTRNEILQEDRRTLALKNLREQIAILKELGYSELETRQICIGLDPSLRVIADLAERDLIKDIRSLDKSE